MDERIKSITESLDLNIGVSEDVIRKVEGELGIVFPNEYKIFMMESNGAEGGIGSHSYISIWPIDTIISLNTEYAVHEFAPGLLIFGSNGSDTAYAFDMRSEEMPIVEIPFIGMELTAIRSCGDSFTDFLEYLYNV